MRVEIRAIGRLKSGPERTLVDDYLKRAEGLGRGVGLGPFVEREIDPRNLADRAAETEALIADLPALATVVALDERGEALTSRAFSGRLQETRDDGVRDMVFLIGGADGFDAARLPAGTRRIAFGPATWPHKLVRVMLAEQLYRAVALAAGSPYHRD
ncbi:23S rRNA (pseudouridine(1915)-N(3))-methyltransferase RlmH [Marinicauda salina]|uniref:Ribosomal RNA large subunit methyltransferase H n=1 Tax=Marinicauda salina TaxID=2135793 RepID=A0A2U2BWY3_9PROT|nr:23S rRNA (pseudouridine(1915)-N(3))-methyltransferase RlmH [Marinicauda salina]PWE18531.1 23S rRNA (pseudouridine(1915)-N(3))-methyltransferase RlmH [Marinicauda salina]